MSFARAAAEMTRTMQNKKDDEERSIFSIKEVLESLSNKEKERGYRKPGDIVPYQLSNLELETYDIRRRQREQHI